MLHGDSHYFRVDKPFQDSVGRRLENFTRVETFGDNAANGNNDVQRVKVLVNARSREVFYVPAANRPRQPNGCSGAVRGCSSREMQQPSDRSTKGCF